MAGLAPVMAEAVAGDVGPVVISFTSFPAEAVRQLEQLCVTQAQELLLDQVSWHRRPDLICAKSFLIGSPVMTSQIAYILPITAVERDWRRVKHAWDDFTRNAMREEGFTTSLAREAAEWREINALSASARKPQ